MLDGNGNEGPSPMDVLLMSLGGCMAIDVRDILEKGRVSVSDLQIELEGERAPDAPRRYTFIRIVVRVAGPAESDRGKVDRAIALSKEKYCSVSHTLRPDLVVETETHIGPRA